MKRLVFLSSLLLALVSCQENKPTETAMEEKGKCPFGFDKGQSAGSTLQGEGPTNKHWWPNQLDLTVLRQHSNLSNPMGDDYDYADQFNSVDYEALKNDIREVMTNSQDWWPADYGNYGPFFIRLAQRWHLQNG
jgi:catalase-peroxidase